jgi:N-acetylglucosamine-6-sulfatase
MRKSAFVVSAAIVFVFLVMHGRPWARPNIVFIVTDDHRADEINLMFNVTARLIQNGKYFVKSYASYPLCCPARATFLTGQYPHNHGVLDNPPSGGYRKLDHTNTLPVWLQRAGYHTVHIGKYLNGYGQQVPPTTIPPGWSEWYGAIDTSTYKFIRFSLNENGVVVRYGSGTENYQTDVYARKAVDLISRMATGAKPFFLSLSFLAPHEDRDDIPGPRPAARHAGRFATAQLPRPPSFNEQNVSDKPTLIRNMPLLDGSAQATLTTAYRRRLESLLAVDEAVKEIIDVLQETQQLQNTVIIFVSDNGFLLGEHRIDRKKVHPYEESVHIPLIIRHPQFPTRQSVTKLVGHVDLAPTIVELAGAKPQRLMDGRSLMALVRNPSASWRNHLLLEAQHVETGNNILYSAVRSNNYVYVEHQTGERELYNLSDGTSSCSARDPHQLVSQHSSACYGSQISSLRSRLGILKDCAGQTCWQWILDQNRDGDWAKQIQSKTGEPYYEIEYDSATVRLWADPQWLETYVESNCKESTYWEYESVIRNHLIPEFGRIPMVKITRDMVEKMVAKKVAAGLSRWHVRNIIVPLREMFDNAIDKGLRIPNPAIRMAGWIIVAESRRNWTR